MPCLSHIKGLHIQNTRGSCVILSFLSTTSFLLLLLLLPLFFFPRSPLALSIYLSIPHFIFLPSSSPLPAYLQRRRLGFIEKRRPPATFPSGAVLLSSPSRDRTLPRSSSPIRPATRRPRRQDSRVLTMWYFREYPECNCAVQRLRPDVLRRASGWRSA